MKKQQWWIVHREAFLMECFSSYADGLMLQKMMKTSPLDAGIDPAYIHRISQEIIHMHALKAGTVSMSASLAVGFLRLATLPAEYGSYVYESLLLVQKLLYLHTNMKQKQLLHHHQLQGYLAVFFGAASALKASGAAAGQLSNAILRRLIKQRLSKAIPLIGASVNTAVCIASITQLANEFEEELSKRQIQHQTYLTIACDEPAVIETPLFTVEGEKTHEELG